MKVARRFWVLWALCVGATAPGSAEPPVLIEFELQDQFDRTYRAADYAGRVLYVIASDKDGSRYNGSWSRAIFDALEGDREDEALATFGVADLSGVPFFLKKMIKGKFPRDQDQWVLMDWKGLFRKAYRFEPGASNILVFATDGRLVHRAHGREVEPQVLDGVVAALREQLDRVWPGG